MANGMIMGGRPSGGNGRGWEVAAGNIPSLNFNEMLLKQDGAYYGGIARYQIPYPLVFQTRTFSNSYDVITAAGGDVNILLASSDVRILVSKGLSAWDYVQIVAIDVDDTFTSPFDLYVFARFVD